MSGFAWTLAEWLVTLSTGAWLELHASPAPGLVVAGVIVVLAISGLVVVCRSAANAAPPPVPTSIDPPSPPRTRAGRSTASRFAPVGGRGARAPGATAARHA